MQEITTLGRPSRAVYTEQEVREQINEAKKFKLLVLPQNINLASSPIHRDLRSSEISIFENLPAEIILRIYQHLPFLGRPNLALASRRMFDLGLTHHMLEYDTEVEGLTLTEELRFFICGGASGPINVTAAGVSATSYSAKFYFPWADGSDSRNILLLGYCWYETVQRRLVEAGQLCTKGALRAIDHVCIACAKEDCIRRSKEAKFRYIFAPPSTLAFQFKWERK